ncbi:hypothetical protein B9479_003128 [Cryptococcus floricola]|uniref:Uncharacterized protein n=1 Tax=Cryptococcus floricola TaxID=2591691 RepID=A0A5D3AZ56_9TREE|nr:hypothetical protein B9479_003128 [Cryptococcus floricola]
MGSVGGPTSALYIECPLRISWGAEGVAATTDNSAHDAGPLIPTTRRLSLSLYLDQ